ncbi:hypothetical protein AAFF_G00052880, partial [Aldrovandia affinis]
MASLPCWDLLEDAHGFQGNPPSNVTSEDAAGHRLATSRTSPQLLWIEINLRCNNQAYNIGRNLVKCEFGQATVTYLGKVVGRGQVRPVDAKVEAIYQFPVPRTRRDLRRFLGMVEMASLPCWDLLEDTHGFQGNPPSNVTSEDAAGHRLATSRRRLLKRRGTIYSGCHLNAISSLY